MTNRIWWDILYTGPAKVGTDLIKEVARYNNREVKYMPDVGSISSGGVMPPPSAPMPPPDAAPVDTGYSGAAEPAPAPAADQTYEGVGSNVDMVA